MTHNRRPALGAHALMWSGARWFTAGLVTALFPFIFILDERVEAATSPVLPLLLVLTLLILALPFALAELGVRRLAGKEPPKGLRIATTWRQRGRITLVLGTSWFLLWMVLGA